MYSEYATLEMEQEAEMARQVEIARTLSGAAERWRETLRAASPSTLLAHSLVQASWR